MRIVVPQRFNIARMNLPNIWDANNPNNSSTIPANGASISAWQDLGTTPNNLIQAVPGSEFTYENPLINTNNGMLLSGSQYMLGSSESYSGNATVSISALVQTSTIAAGNATFLSIKNGSAGYGIGRSGANGAFTAYGNMEYITTTPCFVANTWAVLTVIFQANATINFYLNSASVYTLSTGPSIAATALLCMGAESTTAVFWAGYLQAVIRQIGTAWNTQQRLAIERYLRNRAGL